MRLGLLLAAMVGALVAVPASGESVARSLVVRSPDGHNAISLTLDKDGRPTYSISRNGDEVIAPSPVVLSLDSGPLGDGSSFGSVDRRSVNDSWRPVVGKASLVQDHFEEAVVHLVDAQQRRLDLVLRAYDDGVALRMIVPVQPKTDGAVIAGEETGFHFPRNYDCWGFNPGRFGTSTKASSTRSKPVTSATIISTTCRCCARQGRRRSSSPSPTCSTIRRPI